MMPQKVNPDIAELVRGKTGRAFGDLVAVLTLLKSLPLAYNRDLQEDKENLFDAADAVETSLRALTTLVAEIEFDEVRMRKAAEAGLMTATDLADFLTTKGVPFRKAHAIVKQLAVEAEGDDDRFIDLAREILKNHSGSDHDYLSLESVLSRRACSGGTSPKSVSRQISRATKSLGKNRSTVAAMNRQTARVNQLLKG